ncbi:hypothetical protein, partial [uncultured Porphyromonas sp.]|uniref:hypothetical protein n=1 Tax=uncultured Porphyromonas sp. TaxID=159274 RepID=UPI00258C8F24
LVLFFLGAILQIKNELTKRAPVTPIGEIRYSSAYKAEKDYRLFRKRQSPRGKFQIPTWI